MAVKKKNKVDGEKKIAVTFCTSVMWWWNNSLSTAGMFTILAKSVTKTWNFFLG